MTRMWILLLCVATVAGGCGGRAWPWARTRNAPPPELPPTPVMPVDHAAREQKVRQARQPEAYQPHRLTGQVRVVDGLTVQVNDQLITIGELLHPARARLLAIPEGVTEQQFRERAWVILQDELRRRVLQVLVIQDADRALEDYEKAGIDAQVDAQVRDWTTAVGGSRAALEDKFRQEGTSLEEVRTNHRRELVIAHYIRTKLLPRVHISRADLWSYYQQNLGQYTTEPQVRMQVLALPDSAFWPQDVSRPTPAQERAARENALAQARLAHARVRAGEPFDQLVREMGRDHRAADGGVWDYMAAGSYRESAVEAAAFEQAVGQVSDPIEGQTGVFLVKTLDLRAGNVVSFEQAQQEIESTLRQERYEALQAEFFHRLYDKAQGTLIPAPGFDARLLDRAVELYHRP